MIRIVRFVLVMVLFAIVAGAVASAQQAKTDASVRANLTPDSRYEGYPRSLVEWPSSQPDLLLVVGQEYYEPVDTHLCRYKDRVAVERVRVQEFDEVAWMLTRFRWRWVLRSKGTKVAVDTQGRDLFDYGSQAGQVCCNPRPVSVPVKPVPIEVPPPAPKPEPKPEPKLGCIEVVKDIGTPDVPLPPFAFTLDGGEPMYSDGAGWLRFRDVTPGVRTVEEKVPSGWRLVSVKPEGGRVIVSAGSNCATLLFKNRKVVIPPLLTFTPPPPPKGGRCGRKCGWLIVGGTAIGLGAYFGTKDDGLHKNSPGPVSIGIASIVSQVPGVPQASARRPRPLASFTLKF